MTKLIRRTGWPLGDYIIGPWPYISRHHLFGKESLPVPGVPISQEDKSAEDWEFGTVSSIPVPEDILQAVMKEE